MCQRHPTERIEVVSLVGEHISERTGEQMVELLVPQIVENTDVPQERIPSAWSRLSTSWCVRW